MINTIFEICVRLLVFLGNTLGMSYEAINVWIFVVIWPILTVGLIGVVVWQQRKLRRSER